MYDAHFPQECKDYHAMIADGGPYVEAAAEQRRQVTKWGDQRQHPDGTGGYDADRLATAIRQLVDQWAEAGTTTWAGILAEEVAEAFAETDPARLRAELVQIAAVSITWIDAIDARMGGVPVYALVAVIVDDRTGRPLSKAVPIMGAKGKIDLTKYATAEMNSHMINVAVGPPGMDENDRPAPTYCTGPISAHWRAGNTLLFDWEMPEAYEPSRQPPAWWWEAAKLRGLG